jgi:hypothetical protein
VTAPDTLPDDPATWGVATSRAPTEAERRDLELAWRLVRGATSNAIVLVRDGRLIGLGSGQTSRVDAARQAVEKALAISGEAVLRGAACASDAFYRPRRRRRRLPPASALCPAGRLDARRRHRRCRGGRRDDSDGSPPFRHDGRGPADRRA